MAIISVVRLLRGDAMVRVKTTIDNCVEDHILRVFFPTGIPAETVQAEMPFDVVTRSIKHPDTTGWREPYRPVQPQRAFVDIAAEGRGFALINAGNGQYEAVDSPQRELALTLLRCFRQWNSVRLAEYPDQNGPQCRGEHTFEYAVYPHRGDWVEGGVMRQSHLFNLPMRTAVGGPGNGDLPAERGFMEVASPDIEIAAVKKGEWDDSLVVRLVNTRDADVSTTLKVGLPVASAELCNMKETDIIASLDYSGGAIEIDVPAGKVLTLKLSLS